MLAIIFKVTKSKVNKSALKVKVESDQKLELTEHVEGIAVVKKITNLEELESVQWSTKSTESASVSGTQRKDSFFLSGDGEEVESEEEPEHNSSEASEVSDQETNFGRSHSARRQVTPHTKSRDQRHIGPLNPHSRDQKNRGGNFQTAQKPMQAKRYTPKKQW